ncbi:MAG: ATP synthase F0 subunit B [Myxococcales bacterium]|nr:ATP synthase F0 subunit B [Myxococcales bacterium]MCB9752478.1 ATP synthase F0 subunit B [Myxococcales bacterium]
MKLRNHTGPLRWRLYAVGVSALYFLVVSPPVFASPAAGGHGEAGHGEAAGHGAAAAGHGEAAGEHAAGGHGAVHDGISWLGDEHTVGFVFTLINFAALVAMAYLLVFKNLIRKNAARHDEIKAKLDEATEAKATAEEVIGRVSSLLDQFEREKAEILQTARKNAETSSRQIVEEARAEAEKIRAAAVAAAEREAASRRLEIEREIVDSAIEKAEAILVSQFSESDQRRIVDDYVTRVASAPLAGGAS